MNAGTYTTRATGARLTESSKKKTPCVEVYFEVEGEPITAQLWLTENAMDRAIESLRHTGWEGDDLADLSTVGKRACQIVVEAEQSSYGEQMKVKWINADGGAGGGVSLAPSVARSLAETLRERVRLADAKAAEKRAAKAAEYVPPASSAAATPPADDSDIPF